MKIVALTLLFVAASVCRAAEFIEDFESGVPNPKLSTLVDPTFDISIAGGKARFSRTSGIGDGRSYLYTNFKVARNFTATVEADATLLATGSLGIFAHEDPFVEAEWFDVYFRPNNLIQANVFASSVFTDEVIGDQGANQATLRLRRVGNSVFTEIDLGGGFVTVNSRTDAALNVPITMMLFMHQEVGSNADMTGVFDNWRIEGQEFIGLVPEPTTITLFGLTLLSLVWLRR